MADLDTGNQAIEQTRNTERSGALKAAAVALVLAGGATEAAAESRGLEVLIDPAVTERVMKDSGFMIADVPDGSLIFLPNTKTDNPNDFNVTGRFVAFDDPENPRPLVPNAGKELIEDTGACQTYRHKNNKFEPSMVCNYTVTLDDEFIRAAAYGELPFEDFIRVVNESNTLPAVGGREVTDPVRPETFNLNTEINGQLLKFQAQVWNVCWDASLDNTSSAAFDDPELGMRDERRACGTARVAALDENRAIQLTVAEARLAESAERRAAVEAEVADSAARLKEVEEDVQTLSRILAILRGEN